jgi:hypothetical protein
MGLIGHASAGPLRACVKVTDCCDPSAIGTLTHAKSLVMCVRKLTGPKINLIT